MNFNRLLLPVMATSFLASCGGDPELSKKIEEAKDVANTLKLSSQELERAHSLLAGSISKVSAVSSAMDQKIIENQKALDFAITKTNEEREKLMDAFKTFNEKIARLEKLYISEGVIELTGAEGKINIESFPALAETEVELMEEPNSFPDYIWYSFNARASQVGEWVINQKKYKILDMMTFSIISARTQTTLGCAEFIVDTVSFKNTRDEIVSTKSIKAYLTDIDGKPIKWNIREVNGNKQAFIDKGTKLKLVLKEPLNLALRK